MRKIKVNLNKEELKKKLDVPVLDTPDLLAEKINTLDEKIDYKVLKNTPPAGRGVGSQARNLWQLQDVDIATVDATDGQVLKYSDTNKRWQAGTDIPGVTDHGALTGLLDDDHPQYHTDARGDARYLNESSNLSDLADVATARTNLGLVAGGAGDIWVEKAGDTMTGLLTQDAGINITTVTKPVVPTLALINSAGNVDAGLHYYYVTFYTAIGETELSKSNASITTDALNGQVSITNIEASPDSRVIGRKIYRTTADSNYYQNVKFLATIPDNTTTSYVDNTADADLTGVNYFYQDNTTSYFITVNSARSILPGINNTTFGNGAGLNIDIGGRNTFVGRSAGRDSTSATSNAFFGHESGLLNVSGGNNVAIGTYSMRNALTSSSVAIGYRAGYNQTGTSNVYIGNNAGLGVGGSTTGFTNVGVGTTALRRITSGGNNTTIGDKSGEYITTGSSNVLLGKNTGDNITTGSANVVVGYNIDAPTPTSNYTMTLGNLIFGTGVDGQNTAISSGNIGIGVITPTEKLEVDGGVKLNTATTKPTADATSRGTIWITQGGSGVADIAEICLKSAADTYSWINIATG